MCRMGMSISIFSFVGIEIVAASALEAKWPQRKAASATASYETPRSNDTLIGKTVKFSAIFISALATAAYTLGGFLVSLDIYRGDCDLPRVSWLSDVQDRCPTPVSR